MATTIITIPTAAIDSLRAALKRINKAAVRLSLPAGDVRIIAESRREMVRKTEVHEQANSDLGTVGGVETRKSLVEVVDVELTLPDVGRDSTAEWLVVGRVARVEGANGQNDVFSEDAMVREQFLSTPITCEHCNTNRYRVRSLVCVSGVRAELKQVGYECAKFYVGDAEKEIDMLAFRELVTVLIAPFSDEDGPEWGRSGGRSALALDAVELVARAIRSIRVDGWAPSKHADGQPNEGATWRRVNLELFHGKKDDPAYVEVSDADRAEAEKMIAWVRGVALTGDPADYVPSLQAVFTPEWVSSRRLALAVSLPRAYDRAMEKAAALANPPTEKAPEGRVQVTGTIRSFKTVESQFGVVEKMIVELENRTRVYVSVPGFFTDQVVGSVVTFVATFERSDRDEFFSFGSRPVAPKVKKVKPAKGAKVADPLAPGGEYVAK